MAFTGLATASFTQETVCGVNTKAQTQHDYITTATLYSGPTSDSITDLNVFLCGKDIGYNQRTTVSYSNSKLQSLQASKEDSKRPHLLLHILYLPDKLFTALGC